ncbi:MAG: YgfZ/GcvT domain-containing protein [Porticoccaceae bacterium]
MSNTHRGLIELRGQDSVKFLQGQVTCDLNQLSADKAIRGCHCTPKGRVIFVFAASLVDDDRIVLETHPSIVGTAIASLKKYAVFSKTEINDISGQDLIIETKLNSLQRIKAGIADITLETTDQFIPQMLNLDLLDFISFKKGCYTGQEVVARAHYLGAVKRRMYLLALSTDLVPASGSALLDTEGKQIGTIINAQSSAQGQVEVLAVLSTSNTAINQIAIDQTEISVKLLELPYQLG